MGNLARMKNHHICSTITGVINGQSIRENPQLSPSIIKDSLKDHGMLPSAVWRRLAPCQGGPASGSPQRTAESNQPQPHCVIEDIPFPFSLLLV